MRRRLLKGTQITVATFVILGLGAGMFWPGVMGIFLVPAGLLYLIWAIRAALDKPLSIWLAFASTLVVTAYVGALGVFQARSAIDIENRVGERASQLLVDPTGAIVELPGPQPPALMEAHRRNARRVGAHALALLVTSAGGWLVIGLYAAEWRWATGRRR